MEDMQLARLVEHGDSRAVLEELRFDFVRHYAPRSFARIEYAFHLVEDLFTGKYPGYLSCSTEYHDYAHTLDATLCTSRLLAGKNSTESPVEENLAVNLILAALLHDSGYIQELVDSSGTGAKYTSNHVERSMEFVRKNGDDFCLPSEDIESVCLLISCTGLKNRWDEIHFAGSDEMICGAVLATADILGQMSDRKYLEKLLFLYYEFREAGIDGFNTEFDILRKTLDFYETTKTRLETTLLGSYHYSASYFKNVKGISADLYMNAIERHMSYLKDIILDESTNFRHKLKRIDLESAENRLRTM